MKISVMIAAFAGAALFVGVAHAQMPAAKPLPTVPKLAPAGSHKLQVKQAPAKIGVHGRNDYTLSFATNDALKGDYYGYDGPCAAWNDTNTHHYHFTVYALSVPSLGLSGAFDGAPALTAMKGKVLAQGELVGLYSVNPAVIAKLPK